MGASMEDTTASVRLRLSPRLMLSPTSDMVDTVLVDTATTAMVVSTGDTTASVRPRLSPTSDMVDTVLVDPAATAMEDSTGDTMASVRLRPNPRLLPSPILDTEDMVDTVLVDTAAMAMVVSTGDTTASVKLRPSPTSDMEVMEDTVLVAMASKIFPSICDHIPLNHLVFLHSCILTNK